MIRPVLLFLFILLHAQIFAQQVVVDPGHIAATIANGSVLTKIRNTMQDINTATLIVKNTVSDIRELQQNIDDALWQVKSLIKDDLGIGNITFELDALQQISPDLKQYADFLPELHPLRQGYNNLNPAIGAEILQQNLEYALPSILPQNNEALQELNLEKIMNQQAFNYASSQKIIQMALSYNQLATVMQAKAEQLNETLKKDGFAAGFEEALKMNEAVRINLLETSASYVRKSLELRLLCDQLIQQAINREDPVREKSLQQYKTYLLLDKLM